MPGALAVSPHLDDAVFSCGGTLARLAQAGWDVTVCTVFTRSVPQPRGFALACQTDKGIAADIDYMALRRAEDRVACAMLGATPLWLDFPEAPHRNYGDAAALFGAVAPDDDIDAAIAQALAFGPLRAGIPELILAPQAIGGHVDHVQVMRALRRALPPTVPVLWWADYPYAERPDAAAPFAAVFDALPSIAVAGDAVARRAACAAYRSQLGFQFGGEAALDRALAVVGPVEMLRVQGRASLPVPLLAAA